MEHEVVGFPTGGIVFVRTRHEKKERLRIRSSLVRIQSVDPTRHVVMKASRCHSSISIDLTSGTALVFFVEVFIS
ncbi:MAG: hypothetical protein GTN81_09540 [Proteobacteria bacterium]|nr:hypothetical protein [Pseudomonadota bacterium]